MFLKYRERVNLYDVWSAEVWIFLKTECHLGSEKLKTGGLLGIAQLSLKINFEARDGYTGVKISDGSAKILTKYS